MAKPGKFHIELRPLLFAIRSSFWMIPIALGITALVAAVVIVESDFAIQQRGFRTSPFAMPIESAQMALSTIAGSMITIATLVFSMTLVALTMVSRQLGPRVLLHFMDDRQTQFTLGLFIATFIFALVVLLRVGEDAVDDRSPGIAVFVTAGLAIMSLGVMIRFIHHISTRIQADVIINELGADLNRASLDFVERGHDEKEKPDPGETRKLDKLLVSKSARQVTLEKSGYLRRIDEIAVSGFAKRNDVVVKILARPGEFVLANTGLARLASVDGKKLDDETVAEMAALVSAGNRRTPEASIEFEINALVEVALKALSPGVNDPYTAISCLYRLTDGMRILMHRETDRRISRDEDGAIRILHEEEPFSRYLSIAFDSMREAAGRQTIMLTEMLRMLRNLESLAADKNHRRAIRKRIGSIRELLEDVDSDPVEISDTDNGDQARRKTGKK